MFSFFRKINDKVLILFMKSAQNHNLLSIRDGMISILPLIMVGSIFLLVGVFPYYEIFGIKDFMMRYQANILIPFRLSMNMMALFVSYNIAYSFSKYKNYDPRANGTLSMLAFLMAELPFRAFKVLPEGVDALNISINNTLVNITSDASWMLPLDNMSGRGLFIAIICGLLVPRFNQFFKNRNLIFKMPEGVPESVRNSFEALIPAFFLMIIMFTIRVALDIDLHNILNEIFMPLKNYMNTLYGVLLIIFLESLLWFGGIHGSSIIGALIRPIWLLMIAENTMAFANGEKIPHIAPEPFLQWFVFIGGSGQTLMLAFMMVFVAKSTMLKKLGRISIAPGIFNINEPIIFGTPIMFNPLFFIPFVFAPLISGIVAYASVYYGFVNPPVALVPWTLPAPIGAFLATSDVRAVILVVVNLLIGGLIYYIPFKIYDKKLCEEEKININDSKKDNN